MVRWHKSWCSDPQILVEEGMPKCSACGSLPDLAKMKAAANFVVPWKPPPDEAPEDRNYSWPPSVRFKSEVDGSNLSNAIAARQTPLAGHANTSNVVNTTKAFEPPYNKRLRNEEFRLIWLSTVRRTQSGPVHLELMTFNDGDSPEYEAVSYVWGGEDADDSRQYEIYVGRYWDVILQTRSCYELLRYLTPKHAVRFIWVDAICINQADIVERSIQVTKMKTIYEHCERVFLFPGLAVADIAQNQRKPDFAPRRDFTEINHTLLEKEVLSLRYFGRIWVVQELLLAPSVIIPIRGIHYMIRRELSKEFRLLCGRVVPWFSLVCDPDTVASLSILKALQLTGLCQASDPRDRLYGILGMLGNDTWKPAPDYSISTMQLFVGVCAHLLINLEHVEVLLASAASSAPPNHPTWLPNVHQPRIFYNALSCESAVTNWIEHQDDYDQHMFKLRSHYDWASRASSAPSYIGSKTLGLTVHMHKIFSLNKEKVWTNGDHWGVGKLSIETTHLDTFRLFQYSFTVFGPRLDLSKLIIPGMVDVFLYGNPPMLLFLNRQRSGVYTMLASFRCIEIHFPYGGVKYPPRVAGIFRNVYNALVDAQASYQEFRRRLSQDEWHAMKTIFPGNTWTMRDILDVCIALWPGGHDKFEEKGLRIWKEKMAIVTSGQCSVSFYEKASSAHPWTWVEWEMDERYRRDVLRWYVQEPYHRVDVLRSESRLSSVTVLMENLHVQTKREPFIATMHLLEQLSRTTRKSIHEILEMEPKEEHRYINVDPWPLDERVKLKLEIKVMEVTIV